MKLLGSLFLSFAASDPVDDRFRLLENKLETISIENEKLLIENHHLVEELDLERADIDDLESRVQSIYHHHVAL